eukprot:1894388-Rhodomonas_salina.3
MQGTFDEARGGALLLPLLGLAIAYSVLRTVSHQKAVAEGICMMVFDELCALLSQWPIVGQLVLSLALSLVRPDVDEIVPQLQEYGRWQTASTLLATLQALPISPTLVTFVLFQLGNELDGPPLDEAVHDILTLAFFDALLQDTQTVIQNVMPGDRLFAFFFSLLVFVAFKRADRLALPEKKL